MTKYTILLVDDNPEYQSSVRDYLIVQEQICQVDIAADGFQALEKLRVYRYDIILTELIMPNMDGLSLLEHLNRMGGEKPAVIIVSAIRNESMISYAFTLGVSHFLIKPIDPQTLYRRVLQTLDAPFAEHNHAIRPALSKQTLNEEVTYILLTAGIPAHVKGYHYLREGICMAFYKPKLINQLTKGLYPGIAKKFSTSPSKVERDIRHAIEVAWMREKLVNINEIFGCNIYTKYEKPTNGGLIGLIAERLLMKYGSEKGISPEKARHQDYLADLAREKDYYKVFA